MKRANEGKKVRSFLHHQVGVNCQPSIDVTSYCWSLLPAKASTVALKTRGALQREADEAAYVYENPPIAESLEDRLIEGMFYVLDREWSIRKSSKKAGVSYASLYK